MEQVPNTSAKKVWESVQAHTVRCVNCSKWRLVPIKEKYEEIREGITIHPFTCDIAKQWNPETSCDRESDVRERDVNWLWAMDKPSIPQTPNGWQRILRIRARGGTKFFDVYYVAPSNRRWFRSMAEVSRYLDEHPHYAQEGVDISQFSFKCPVPLDENYVVKRHARSASRYTSVDPMLWIVPYTNNNVQSVGPESTSEDAGPSGNSNTRKRARGNIESQES